MDSRPLIVHVVHHLIMGGMENGLVNLINNLPHDEFRHAVVCIEHYSEFRARITRKDVDVIAMHRSHTGVTALRLGLFRLFRKLTPAIVHSRNQSGLDALFPAWLAGVRSRVHSEHGWEVDNLRGGNWKPALLRKINSPLVSRYVAVSEDLGAFLTRRIGISPSRLTVICNGVDTDRFTPGPAPADLGLPIGFVGPDTVCIGTVGRLQPVKDQATLIAAVAHLAHGDDRFRRRLRLLVVGDGPRREFLRQQAAQTGIADLCWFPGARDDIAGWLRAMDVFVLSSLNEGISNTLLEAMATGLPTLATRVGGNVELVEADATGAYFAAGDVSALAALLGRYVTAAPLRFAHGKAARQRAVSRFSLHAMLTGYRALYREQLCLQQHY